MFWICVILTSAKCWRSLKLFEIKKTLFFLWNRLLWCPCFVLFGHRKLYPTPGKISDVHWSETAIDQLYGKRGIRLCGFISLYFFRIPPPCFPNTGGQRKSIPGSRQDSHIAPNLSCAHRTTCRKLICNHNVCKYAPWEPCKRPLYQHPNALAVNFPIYKSNSQVYTTLSHVCLWQTWHKSSQIHCWCYNFPRFWMVPIVTL